MKGMKGILRGMRDKLIQLLLRDRAAGWAAPMRMIRLLLGWRGMKPALGECRSILVVRPDEIGDVVLTSSFFRNLRRSAPAARITALTGLSSRPILEGCPYVDEVLGLPFGRVTTLRERIRQVSTVLRLRRGRFVRGFDVVLMPRVDADWYSAELIAHLMVGRGVVLMNSAGFIYSIHQPRENPGLVDLRYVAEFPESEVLAGLRFLEWCGGSVGSPELEFWESEADKAFAEQWWGREFPTHRRLVFHAPGSRSVLRRWPRGRSRELVEKLLASTDFAVVAVGGPQDDWVEEELRLIGHPRFRMEFGTFTLGQLGALIRVGGYFVGGDSGPMHIAAAVGAHTVGIFGPGSEMRFRPWGRRAQVVSRRLPCSPDGSKSFEAQCQKCIHEENRCLTEVSADSVIDLVREL